MRKRALETAMSLGLAKPLRGTMAGLHTQIDLIGGGNERSAGFIRLFIFFSYQPTNITKTKIIALIIASLTFATAAEKIKAPNGGRIINTVTPNAEFLVAPDKKIEIRFLDAAGKVIAPAAQVVTVTMGVSVLKSTPYQSAADRASSPGCPNHAPLHPTCLPAPTFASSKSTSRDRSGPASSLSSATVSRCC
jgi:hypothetical protein